MRRKAEHLRRNQVKLQVRLDEVRNERGEYELAQRTLARSKQLFSAFVAFQKWKAQQANDKQ